MCEHLYAHKDKVRVCMTASFTPYYINLTARKCPTLKDHMLSASLLTPCLLTRQAVITAAHGGDPFISIQDFARHRWQQNEWEATRKTGYSPLCLVSPS